MEGDTAGAAEVFGVFATVWGLMQFLCSPLLGALSDRYGRRPIILISCLGLGLDCIFMAVAPLSHPPVHRPDHLRHHGGHDQHRLRLHRRCNIGGPPGQGVRRRRPGLRPGLRARAGDRRPAGRPRSAPAVLGVGRSVPDQRRVRLVRTARIAAAGAPHGVRLAARQSAGLVQAAELAAPAARPGGCRFPGQCRPSGPALGLRALRRLPLRLDRENRGPDAGVRRPLRGAGARLGRRAGHGLARLAARA
jgi:hypothetical protein